MTSRLHRLSVLWKTWMFYQEPEQQNSEQEQSQDELSEPAARKNCDQSEQLTLISKQEQSSSSGSSEPRTSSTEAQLGDVFQVDNASEGEEGALSREASQRRSRRRFRKVNPRGERELITDGQDPTVRTDVNVF